jgi:diguanylate cyclase (GGDEF)-like protein
MHECYYALRNTSSICPVYKCTLTPTLSRTRERESTTVSWAPMNPVHSRRLAQEVDDTYRLALVGGAFYLAGWLVIGIYGNAFSRAPVVSWTLVLTFVVLAIVRFLHRPPGADEAATRPVWLRYHWAIVIFSTALWGTVFCWIILDPGFGPAQTAALLGTLGLATAFAHGFSMRRGFAFTGITLLYLPGLILLWRDPANRSSALIMTIYLAYVVVSTFRSNAEYNLRLDLDQQLRDQRDLFAQQSLIDPLTELANRRHFAEVLAEASARAGSFDEPLTLLLLDLDHFKKINDTHGHAIGDACLVAFAKRIKGAYGGVGDLVARLGGEEFGVVLRGQDTPTACARAEHFRADLVDHPIAVEGILLAVTASMGIAQFDKALHRDPDNLYRAADSSVYRAKAEGRNRVCADNFALVRQEIPIAR